MMIRLRNSLTGVVLSLAAAFASGQQATPASDVRLRIVSARAGKRSTLPAVVWLESAAGTSQPPFLPHGHYTLLQKNRMFSPHLQVIPVGAVVQFPNEDPFFHNVFSLFDGKRFDLGLYEAGSSKAVTFPREGVSYIFCNIHPEMSAVIVSLATPLYAIADTDDLLVLHGVPPGDYELHLWVEGAPPSFLAAQSRRIRVGAEGLDLGEVRVPAAPGTTHDNKFGKPYVHDSRSPYE